MHLRITGAILGLALAACASTPAPTGVSGVSGHSPPLAEGSARLRIIRSDEVLVIPRKAQIRVSGKSVAELDSGEQHVIDLPAGPQFVTAKHRMAAAAAPLRLDLAAGGSYRVLVTLDPERFPTYDGPLRPLKFLGESLDAPNDDRRSMFRLQQVAEPVHARPRLTAARAEAELDREAARVALPAAPER